MWLQMEKVHHVQQDVVEGRPEYRESRWGHARKVYTVNLESKYLLVQNVHALGVTKELLELFSLYGEIEEYRILDEFPAEEFCDVYWIKFKSINSARSAKKKLDNQSFYGKNLHVCYAPEYETVADTREKLTQRRKVIAQKTHTAATAASQHHSPPEQVPHSTNSCQLEPRSIARVRGLQYGDNPSVPHRTSGDAVMSSSLTETYEELPTSSTPTIKKRRRI